MTCALPNGSIAHSIIGFHFSANFDVPCLDVILNYVDELLASMKAHDPPPAQSPGSRPSATPPEDEKAGADREDH
jgi:hypothetical protein